MTWTYECICGADIVPLGKERSRFAMLVPMDERNFYVYGTCSRCGCGLSIAGDLVPDDVQLALPERTHKVGRPATLERVQPAPKGSCWVRTTLGAVCRNPVVRTPFTNVPRLKCCEFHRRIYNQWLMREAGK